MKKLFILTILTAIFFNSHAENFEIESKKSAIELKDIFTPDCTKGIEAKKRNTAISGVVSLTVTFTALMIFPEAIIPILIAQGATTIIHVSRIIILNKKK